MSNSKIKLYKNSSRKIDESYSPYVPQWQQMGVEPLPSPQNTVISRSSRSHQQNYNHVNQPYADSTPPAVGRNKPIPNVGNNIEQAWSSLNSNAEVFDDFEYSTENDNQNLIDNNDYVTDKALGINNSKLQNNRQPQEIGAASDDSDVLSVLHSLNQESYILLVDSVPFCSGPKEDVESQASLLVFGEHEYCDGQPIEVERISIFKKIKIKVGLFIG